MRTVPSQPQEVGTIVRAPSDELDIAAVPELRARLAAAHRPGAQVVLDMREVTFMDSSALAVVLAADRRLEAAGGALRLANVSAQVRRVLRICGLAHLVLHTSAEQLRRKVCRAAHLVH